MNLSNVLNGRIKDEQKEELIDIAIFLLTSCVLSA